MSPGEKDWQHHTVLGERLSDRATCIMCMALRHANHDEGAFFRIKIVILSVHRCSVPYQISGVALGSLDHPSKTGQLCVNHHKFTFFTPSSQKERM